VALRQEVTAQTVLSSSNILRTLERSTGNIGRVGVYAGFIETEMAAAASGPRTAPAQVAARTFEGVEAALNHVLADERTRQIYDAVGRDPEQLERTLQEAWNQRNR
jgi:hypothetical protein